MRSTCRPALPLHAACKALAAEAGVRAVIVHREGRCCGVGGDFEALSGNASKVAGQPIESMHARALLLTAVDAPVIAGLHCAVPGGSMSLARPATSRSPSRA